MSPDKGVYFMYMWGREKLSAKLSDVRVGKSEHVITHAYTILYDLVVLYNLFVV